MNGLNRLHEWSVAVRARDGCCVRCGSKRGLHAHHKVPKAERPELKFDVDNGETLCVECHSVEHKARPVRVRAAHRKTLERKIEALEAQVASLEVTVHELRGANKELRGLLKPCVDGVCHMFPARKDVLARYRH